MEYMGSFIRSTRQSTRVNYPYNHISLGSIVRYSPVIFSVFLQVNFFVKQSLDVCGIIWDDMYLSTVLLGRIVYIVFTDPEHGIYTFEFTRSCGSDLYIPFGCSNIMICVLPVVVHWRVYSPVHII